MDHHGCTQRLHFHPTLASTPAALPAHLRLVAPRHGVSAATVQRHGGDSLQRRQESAETELPAGGIGGKAAAAAARRRAQRQPPRCCGCWGCLMRHQQVRLEEPGLAWCSLPCLSDADGRQRPAAAAAGLQ